MMANSSRDPYWQAGVRREATEHPESSARIEDECSICHMPMARYESKLAGREGEVFAHLSFDSGERRTVLRLTASRARCVIRSVKTSLEPATALWVDLSSIRPARMAGAPCMVRSKLTPGKPRSCAAPPAAFAQPKPNTSVSPKYARPVTRLYTKPWDPEGKVIGELPEQVPYQEWLHSEFRETRAARPATCQW